MVGVQNPIDLQRVVFRRTLPAQSPRDFEAFAAQNEGLFPDAVRRRKEGVQVARRVPPGAQSDRSLFVQDETVRVAMRRRRAASVGSMRKTGVECASAKSQASYGNRNLFACSQ